MKYDVFLSYKYTGVPEQDLHHDLSAITTILEQKQLITFCSLKEEFKKESYNDIVAYCLKQQEQSKLVLFYLAYEEPSSGMLKELQKAKELHQNYLVAIKKGLSHDEFLEGAKYVIVYKTFDYLLKELNNLNPEDL